jgi:hypothetical protein
MKFYLQFLFSLSLLWSCSQKPTDEITSEQDSISVSNQNEKTDWENAKKIEKAEMADSTRKNIYQTELNEKTVFYVQKKGKWGLEYEDSSELLAIEYDKIYSPNITAREYVEVLKDGKLGLFDYVRKIMIAPKYDLIYPADGTKHIAIGKIDTQFFGIISENETEVLSSEDSPTYANLEAETIFDLKKSKVIPVFEVKEEYDFYASGVVFTPSFVSNLGFASKTESVSFDETGEGIIQVSAKIERAESITEKLKILFILFYEEGVGVRDGYYVERTQAIVVNESDKVISSKQFAEIHKADRRAIGFCENMLDYFMLSERLLEVKNISNAPENHLNYTAMTQFDYYKVENDGKLETNRFYDCTKFASINSSHFEGCFYISAREDEDMEDGNIWASDHLSIADLDIM